jgi:hypothetical protein
MVRVSNPDWRIGLHIEAEEVSRAKKKKKRNKKEGKNKKSGMKRDSNDRLHETSVNISSSLGILPSTRSSYEGYRNSILKLIYHVCQNIPV